MGEGEKDEGRKIVQIVVPPRTQAGSTIRVVVEGTSIDVKVPKNVRAGQKLNIHMSSGFSAPLTTDDLPTDTETTSYSGGQTQNAEKVRV